MQQEEELPYDCELLPTQGAYNSVYNVQGATPPKVCRISVVPNVDVGKVNAKYPSKEEKNLGSICWNCEEIYQTKHLYYYTERGTC